MKCRWNAATCFCNNLVCSSQYFCRCKSLFIKSVLDAAMARFTPYHLQKTQPGLFMWKIKKRKSVNMAQSQRPHSARSEWSKPSTPKGSKSKPITSTPFVFTNAASVNHMDFTWTVDGDLFDSFLNAKPGEGFESTEFSFCEGLWKLKCYPNGTKKYGQGNVSLFLANNKLPPGVIQLGVRYEFECIEV